MVTVWSSTSGMHEVPRIMRDTSQREKGEHYRFHRLLAQLSLLISKIIVTFFLMIILL